MTETDQQGETLSDHAWKQRQGQPRKCEACELLWREYIKGEGPGKCTGSPDLEWGVKDGRIALVPRKS